MLAGQKDARRAARRLVRENPCDNRDNRAARGGAHAERGGRDDGEGPQGGGRRKRGGQKGDRAEAGNGKAHAMGPGGWEWGLLEPVLAAPSAAAKADKAPPSDAERRAARAKAKAKKVAAKPAKMQPLVAINRRR